MIRGAVLIDAGPIVAILARRDQHHRRCVDQLRELTLPFLTCWPVVAEAAYLLRRSGVSFDAVLTGIERGHLELLPLGPADIPGIAAVLRKYHDHALDLADACLMHLAEREAISDVFTLDRRHFGLFRTSQGAALSLLPEANA